MLDVLAPSWVNAAISDVVMGSPDALPNSAAIAARRLESGMFTVCAIDVNGIEKTNQQDKGKTKDWYFHRFCPLKLETSAGHWCLNGHATYPIRHVLLCLATNPYYGQLILEG